MDVTLVSLSPIGSPLTDDREMGVHGVLVEVDQDGSKFNVLAISERFAFDELLTKSPSVVLRNTIILRQLNRAALKASLLDIGDLRSVFAGVLSEFHEFVRVPTPPSSDVIKKIHHEEWVYADTRGYDVWYFERNGRKCSCVILSREYYLKFFDLSERVLPAGAYLVVSLGILAIDFRLENVAAGILEIDRLDGPGWDFDNLDRTTFVAGGDGRLFARDSEN